MKVSLCSEVSALALHQRERASSANNKEAGGGSASGGRASGLIEEGKCHRGPGSARPWRQSLSAFPGEIVKLFKDVGW